MQICFLVGTGLSTKNTLEHIPGCFVREHTTAPSGSWRLLPSSIYNATTYRSNTSPQKTSSQLNTHENQTSHQRRSGRAARRSRRGIWRSIPKGRLLPFFLFLRAPRIGIATFQMLINFAKTSQLLQLARNVSYNSMLI